MKRIAVVGATGYAGAELVRILAGHPEVKITVLTSRQYAGERFDRVYPAMGGLVPLGRLFLSTTRLMKAIRDVLKFAGMLSPERASV